MSIDTNKGIVTVQNDATGAQHDFNIGSAEGAKYSPPVCRSRQTGYSNACKTTRKEGMV